MKDFYNEILEREAFLVSEEQTEEIKIRLNEIRLAIIRVQQILLNEIGEYVAFPKIKKKASSVMFGDDVDYPVIKSIVGIINSNHNDKTRKYCVTTIQEFREKISQLTSIDKVTRKYLLNLLKLDFKNRLYNIKMEENLRSHLINLIFGIYKTELKKI